MAAARRGFSCCSSKMKPSDGAEGLGPAPDPGAPSAPAAELSAPLTAPLTSALGVALSVAMASALTVALALGDAEPLAVAAAGEVLPSSVLDTEGCSALAAGAAAGWALPQPRSPPTAAVPAAYASQAARIASLRSRKCVCGHLIYILEE